MARPTDASHTDLISVAFEDDTMTLACEDFSEGEHGLQSHRDIGRWARFLSLGFKLKEMETLFLRSRMPYVLNMWRLITIYSLIHDAFHLAPRFLGVTTSVWVLSLDLVSVIGSFINFFPLFVFRQRLRQFYAHHLVLIPIYMGFFFVLLFARHLSLTQEEDSDDISRDVTIFIFFLAVINVRLFVLRHATCLLLLIACPYGVSLFFLPSRYRDLVVDAWVHRFLWAGSIFVPAAVCQEYFERNAFIIQIRGEVENKARRKAEHEATRQKTETLFTLAKMFHEIRTPLGCLLGLNDLLMVSQCAEKRQEYAQSIQSTGSHLLQLLNDILDYSKFRAGNVTLNESWHDPIAALTDCSTAFTSSLAQKNINLDIDMDPSFSGKMKFDKTRVHQICTNFLSNGIKFTPEGGSISFQIRFEVDVLRPDGRILSVRVVDSGIGMSSDQKERVFEEFYQVQSTRTRSTGGAGLGLSITSNLAKVMQGTVGVESIVNEGSTFWFRCFFPTSEGPCIPLDSSETASAAVEAFDNIPLKILLVDDTPLNIRVFQAQLERWRCLVITADNGKRAIEIMDDESTEVDAIIMDVHMPEIDGLDTSRIITERHPLVPVFGLTADLTIDENSVSFKDSGMRAVLYKPLTEQHIRTIRGILSNPIPQPILSPNLNKIPTLHPTLDPTPNPTLDHLLRSSSVPHPTPYPTHESPLNPLLESSTVALPTMPSLRAEDFAMQLRSGDKSRGIGLASPCKFITTTDIGAPSAEFVSMPKLRSEDTVITTTDIATASANFEFMRRCSSLTAPHKPYRSAQDKKKHAKTKDHVNMDAETARASSSSSSNGNPLSQTSNIKASLISLRSQARDSKDSFV